MNHKTTNTDRIFERLHSLDTEQLAMVIYSCDAIDDSIFPGATKEYCIAEREQDNKNCPMLNVFGSTCKQCIVNWLKKEADC